MQSDDFYKDLPILNRFLDVTNIAHYREIPDNWDVAVSDIVNSTKEIQEGKYKEVNTTGASIINSALDLCKPLEVPYLFGGDGAILCTPNSQNNKIEKLLFLHKRHSKEKYNFDLRTGIINYQSIKKAGYKVLIAKYRAAENHIQAVFLGGGLEYAERFIKNKLFNYSFSEDKLEEFQIENFELQWDDIPGRHGEIVALIVKAVSPSVEKNAKVYKKVISEIRKIYGRNEIWRRGENKNWLETNMPFLWHRKSKDVFKDEIQFSDFKKFDNALRRILSGSAEQRERMVNFLETTFSPQEITYGLHISSSALLSKTSSKNNGRRFFFIDGAEGGYAMAARQIKQKSESLAL